MTAIHSNAFRWLLAGLMCLLSGFSVAENTVSITFYHTDALGSVIATADEFGNLKWRRSYQPYGEIQPPQNPADTEEPLSYTGKPRDATGLVYFGARYYDPLIGRFMGVDPAGIDPANPHSFNRYAYAHNNPYKYIDPDGKFAILAFVAAAVTSAIIANNALNAYDQNTSVFDQGISGKGVQAAAKSVATDTAIVAGSAVVGGGVSVLGKKILGSAASSTVPMTRVSR
jgi:RHS repeat-associated protein